MGAKDSKPSSINYEDAVKRVNDNELRRIREAFKKSAGAGGTTLSKNAFLQDVLSESVPSVLADWLYGACGGTQRGIAFKELLCGLVLLTRGTQDEKIKFLWNVYCNESSTYILRQEFTKALQIEATYQPTYDTVNSSAYQSTDASAAAVGNGQSLSHTSILISLFGQSDRVTFEQFKSWIISHKKGTVLSRWLLLESAVNLTTELETPTFFQSLAGVTHLEEQDIGDLEKVFWLLKGSAKTGQLDLESLGPLISPPVPRAALAGVFLAFDENRDGHIDFKELCCGVSAACRGPSVERSKFCFKVFDIDRDGILNHKEIKEMIDILLFVTKESSNSTINFKQSNITDHEAMADLYARINKTSSQISSSTTAAAAAATASNNATNNISEQFTVTQEEFMMWTVQSTLNLVQPFLDLLFEVCHIVLGLRPQCKHLEHDIVKGWLARETKRGYSIGQFWYLIANDWYQNWQQYTQSVSSAPCHFCKTMSNNYATNQRNNAIDEAMVCDESFTSNSTESMGDLLAAADSSSLGSGSSGISCGRTPNSPPGPIDNSGLVAPITYKNVQTLTGEGGRLKRDLILSQHKDYELVPESLWKALSQWYKGPLPLPRQVIQPTDSPDVELELYPLNLKILRHQNQPPVAQSVSTWGPVASGYGAITASSYTSTNSTVPSAALQPPKKYLAYTAAFSRLATVKQVSEFLCQRLKLKLEDVRLWHICSMGDITCLLEDDNFTLQELMIVDNDQFLLEIRNKDLTWPEELGSLSLTQSGGISPTNNFDRRATLASIQSVHAPGATGLHNLGNTCFMNAALQVLFNTQPLTQYFKQGMHMYELNTTNKLGTKGQLALRYADLLKEVWTASTRSVAPLKIRFCMTKHAPQFAGGGQHDSQELLEWLLDGLHEDLNRVTEKPYSELKDSDGRADSIVAAEAWAQHHTRNQSIVIDLFYGQLKSKVSCLGCGRESVRFDPFSLLSLPLPVENYTYCEVLVILLDGSVPIKYGLRLNPDSKYIDFKKELSKLCNLHSSLMLVCELANSQIRCILVDEQKLKASTATELFVYEMPKSDSWRLRTNSDLGINIENGLKDIQRNPALLLSDQHQLTTTSTTSTTTASSEETTGTTSPLTTTTNKCIQINTNDINTESRTSKQTGELSCSPESTFASAHRRTSVAVTLLNLKDTSSISESTLPQNNFTNSTITNCSKRISYSKNDDDDNLDDIDNDNDDDDDDIGNDINYRNNGNNNNNCINCGGGRQNVDERFYYTSMDDGGNNRNIINNHKCDNSIETNRLNCNKNSNNSNSSNSIIVKNAGDRNRIAGGYLIAVHRKLSRQETYFLSYHKSRPSLFGVPLLIPCYEGGTNKDLYCAVWIQVARLLSPLPPTPPDQANHATDCDDSLGYEFPFILRAVSEGGRVCALCQWSKFCRGCEIPCNDDPLLKGSLSSANSSNASTPKLSSRESMPNSINRQSSSEISFGEPSNTSAIHIAIDWDPTALHLRYQSTREKVWNEHESVGTCRKQQTEPVDLDHCLRAFTSEEKLEQWYHCAHCKGKKPATKKLQIWKLPPILIIHLKRFNYVNNKWVKSQKVVNFPFDNFDPTPYLASVPQETILRHKELLELHSRHSSKLSTSTSATTSNHHLSSTDESYGEMKNMRNIDCDEEIIEFDRENSGNCIDSIKENDLELINDSVGGGGGGTSSTTSSTSTLSSSSSTSTTITTIDSTINTTIVSNSSLTNEQNDASLKRTLTSNGGTTITGSGGGGKNFMHNSGSSGHLSSTKRQPSISLGQRKRLVSTSLTKTPVIDGEFTDFHDHRLTNGQDPYDLKYQLYAVVSHSGMLNGGHYVSYAANPNKSWYCYNDSSCREIPNQPNIDPGSAYLLFYERKGLNYPPYLPNIKDKPMPNGNLIDPDDNDNDLRKMCVLS